MPTTEKHHQKTNNKNSPFVSQQYLEVQKNKQVNKVVK